LNPEAVSENNPATSTPVWLITANASKRRRSVRHEGQQRAVQHARQTQRHHPPSHCRAAAGSSGRTKRSSA
jgi:hypothetical protein